MEQANLSYIQQLSAGDKEFEQTLIAIIKEEFPKEKEAYFKNLKAKNYEKVAENVHKISILALEKSYKIAAEFENNLKENNPQLKTEFHSILQTITHYLNTL